MVPPEHTEATGTDQPGRDGGTDGTPRRHPDVRWEPLDAEVVAYRTGSDDAHILNPAAALIWTSCDGGRSVEGLVGVMMERYGIDRERARTDVEACLAHLRALGLLINAEGGELPDLDA